MAFKELASLDAEVTTALGGRNKKTGKNNPTEAEGYYLGSRKVETKIGVANIHFLQTAKGNLGVWGKADLDRKILAVTPGTMVRITQSGMTPTPRGDMYKYKVEVDTDNTIEVSAAAEPTVTATAYDDGDDDSSYEASEDEEDTYEAPAPAAKPQMSALERKAKVDALLKRK